MQQHQSHLQKQSGKKSETSKFLPPQHTDISGIKRLRQLTPSQDDMLALELHKGPQLVYPANNQQACIIPYKRRKLIDWVNTQQRRDTMSVKPGQA